MFQLDDNFLNDVGLGAMPTDQQQPFLQHIYQELELRVGTRLSEGMSDEQLAEFEAIIDRKLATIDPWLAQNAPNYQVDPLFQRFYAQATGANPPLQDPTLVAKTEFTSTKWLELNRPNYREVVAQVLAELKQEIAANKDAILGGGQNQAVAA
jgi:hypothetical protein